VLGSAGLGKGAGLDRVGLGRGAGLGWLGLGRGLGLECVMGWAG
jgi:hypothetical protein